MIKVKGGNGSRRGEEDRSRMMAKALGGGGMPHGNALADQLGFRNKGKKERVVLQCLRMI